jgi:hypothetical protein
MLKVTDETRLFPWHPTMNLRWNFGRLEQQWAQYNTKNLEWRPVPDAAPEPQPSAGEKS